VKHPGSSWHDVPEFPKAAIAALDAGFALHTTTVLEVQRSRDGSTTKLLVRLQDGLQVEAVVMEYDNTGGCLHSTVCVYACIVCVCCLSV
jgi:adenine C2-methylase RlmN of 23S rRNA A2503 and tRNA A37